MAVLSLTNEEDGPLQHDPYISQLERAYDFLSAFWKIARNRVSFHVTL